MYPKLHRLFAAHSLALRDLILMMRKDEINTAGVNIKLLAQVFRRHRGAFDMPARKAYAPGAWPVHLPVLGTTLPQSKVFGRIFILGYLHLLATMPTGTQVFYSVAGKFPIVRESADIVI